MPFPQFPPFKFLTGDYWVITPTGSSPNTAPPGNAYTISRSADPSFPIALYYNGNRLVNPLHYRFSVRTVTLNFDTEVGDNLYAQYMATTYT